MNKALGRLAKYGGCDDDRTWHKSAAWAGSTLGPLTPGRAKMGNRGKADTGPQPFGLVA